MNDKWCLLIEPIESVGDLDPKNLIDCKGSHDGFFDRLLTHTRVREREEYCTLASVPRKHTYLEKTFNNSENQNY